MTLTDILAHTTLVPVMPYVNYWENTFALNKTFLAAAQERADSCGYTDYINTYLTFPPRTVPPAEE